MSDSYKHVPDGVAATISGLNEIIDGYRETIQQLTILVNEIGSSTAWRDVQLKPLFISKANSYLECYRKVLASMETYVSYLTKKSNGASDLEEAYSRG